LIVKPDAGCQVRGAACRAQALGFKVVMTSLLAVQWVAGRQFRRVRDRSNRRLLNPVPTCCRVEASAW
jgi:hypothetical protein